MILKLATLATPCHTWFGPHDDTDSAEWEKMYWKLSPVTSPGFTQRLMAHSPELPYGMFSIKA